MMDLSLTDDSLNDLVAIDGEPIQRASTGAALASEKAALEDFLARLRARDVVVEARDGKLKISAPAGVLDAALKAELKRHKAALLAALTGAASGASEPTGRAEVEEKVPGLVPLTAAELKGRIPLTPAQQGIWLIDHFHPENVAYNIPEAFRFEQAIELKTVQAAADGLIARHRILRTSLHEEDGELFHTVHDSAEAKVGFTDLSALPAEERERQCGEAIRSLGRRPFDLTQAPLVRFHLLRLGAESGVVFLNIHHIIADRVSLYVLREELAALARAAVSGTEAMLPEIPVQFPDYAAWVARQMQSQRMEGQVRYWRRKLENLPAFLELPHSHPMPEKRTYWGSTKAVQVDAATRAGLNRIGMEEGASPFMTFLAVFAVSVARWSQSRRPGAVDFCIGSPITQRKEAATRRMIGLFVNMLAFRCRIEPGMSFRAVLRQVRGTALEAYEHSDVPFQRLVREINPDRSSQRSPIFQTMFGYETYLASGSAEVQMNAEPGTARYDLSLHLSEMTSEGLGGGLTGLIEYGTDLFDATDIDGLAAESEAVAAGVLREPDDDVFTTGWTAAAPVKSAGGVQKVGGTSGVNGARVMRGGRVKAALRRMGRMLPPLPPRA